MGRRRSRATRDLPPYVYKNRRGYVHREYAGGKLGRETWLAPLEAPISEVFRAYEACVTGKRRDTLAWLLEEYHASSQFAKLADRTKVDYCAYRTILCSYPITEGTFGQSELVRISKRTIRSYLDTYKGGSAPTAANRHIQYLKAAWNWAEERLVVAPNPCVGVKLNVERSRDRYVTQDELANARALAKGYLPILMELAYLCRARVHEVTRLQESDVLEDGLRVIRGKGSDGEITLWTPRLRAAVEAARGLHPNAPAPQGRRFLLHNKAGLPLKKNTIDTALQRLMVKVQKAGGERFTLHDLKAAGFSDQEDQFAGHRSARMYSVYNRKLRKVKPPE